MLSENSDFSQSNSLFNKPPKTKAQYSRNVKKLKLKLLRVEEQIQSIQKKIKIFENTSNDKMIALKISKFCKQRRITPQMIFRCADKLRTNNVDKLVFKQTLTSLGIKLSQHELQRLQYLLDEDISGQISWKQYNSFLAAFRIKGQYSSEDQLLKDLFKKIDLSKLSQQEKNRDKKHRQLLNYEQFLKFCHRNLTHLKDKQIAAIFNILQKNNLIDLDQFIEYLKKRQQQRRKIEERNKKRQKKGIIVDKTDQTNTLKGFIKILLKNRTNDSKALFHTIQFIKLQKVLNKNKTQILQLFREIDKQKKGSFGYNQIIQFYIQKQKNKDILFAYQLMGRKMLIQKQIPEDVLFRYNGGPTYKKINLTDFKKFMSKEFGVIQSDAELLFRALEKKQDTVPLRIILDAMKLQQGQKRVVYIKPTDWKTQGKDYWKKKCMTILFNPFVALRFCIQIVEDLKKVQQPFWDDFQFGPTYQDPFGIQSIGLDSLQILQTKWIPVQSLNMKQFYSQGNPQDYLTSSVCPSDIFPKTLCELNHQQPSFLWTKQKIDYNIRKVQQSNLQLIFNGVYPLIFHSFAAYGIYVFKYFVHEKWAYVILDNKIPCNVEGQPLFSYQKNKKYSWISLIEKGYAKIKGNYQKIFQNSLQQLIYQLNRKITLSYQIKALQTPQQKDKIWNKLYKILKQTKQQKLYSFVSQASISQLSQNKVQTGFIKNALYLILSLMQFKDQKSENYHKSHRIVALQNIHGQIKNQKVWNPSWNSGQDENKYDIFLAQIMAQFKTNGVSQEAVRNKSTIMLNYKLFRNIFDQILWIKNVSFDNMIILRKTVQFEQKFVCRYEINSKRTNKQPIRLLVTLNRIRSPDQTQLQLTLKNEKNPNLLQKRTTKKKFSTHQFQIDTQLHQLQIKVLNWNQGQDSIYSLTFYILSPLFHLKQLDRQLLFKNVSPYEQMYYLDIDQAEQKQRKYIYRNYFKAAERGSGCC